MFYFKFKAKGLIATQSNSVQVHMFLYSFSLGSISKMVNNNVLIRRNKVYVHLVIALMVLTFQASYG